MLVISYVHTKISQIKMSNKLQILFFSTPKTLDTKIFTEIACGVNGSQKA